MVVAKAAEDKVLVQSPLAPRPALMTRDELLAVWDGGLILMTRRAGLSDSPAASTSPGSWARSTNIGTC